MKRGICILLVLLMTLSVVADAAAQTGDAVWVAFDSLSELAMLARELDIWEVERDPLAVSGRLKALVSPARQVWLRDQGFAVEAVAPLEIRPAAIPSYPCYRTIDELAPQLATWAAAYSDLAELRVLGTSYEGRDITALRLTNETTGLDKPVLFVMANIHGRELITPELAMAFIERLLTQYGADADITWLLDHQIVEVVVSANPDGHVRNEAGEPWAYWRKNANPENGYCGGVGFGVDLNRNSGFMWGGASADPCYELYQGPIAVSEGETQIVEAFLRGLFPDERPEDLTTPAPVDKPGVFITVHSYGNLVIWPWGHTYTLPPNSAGLSALGHKMATYNGYVAKQASLLYPTTGSTDDFAYGELGVASYTFEVGTSGDGFYPSCSRYDALIQPNLGALVYAAKVARAPYLLPAGPDVEPPMVRVTVDGVSATVAVTATVSDGATGGQAIAAAEVYVDIPPWEGGLPTALSAVDGAYDAISEVVAGVAPLGAVLPGRRLVYVRGQDADANWGPLTGAFITVTRGLQATPEVHGGYGRSGETVVYTSTLSNTGTLTQTVTLTRSSASWAVTVVPTRVVQAPGAAHVITASVTVPEELGPGDADVFTATARVEEAPWLSREIRVETRGLWYVVILPYVMRSW